MTSYEPLAPIAIGVGDHVVDPVSTGAGGVVVDVDDTHASFAVQGIRSTCDEDVIIWDVLRKPIGDLRVDRPAILDALSGLPPRLKASLRAAILHWSGTYNREELPEWLGVQRAGGHDPDGLRNVLLALGHDSDQWGDDVAAHTAEVVDGEE